MTDLPTEPNNGTRWPRTIAVMAPALIAVAAIGINVMNGAIAASFTSQSSTAELVAGNVIADDVGAVLVLNPTKFPDGQVGGKWVTRFGIANAQISGLCIAQRASLFGKPVTLLITADDGDPATMESVAPGVTMDLFQAIGDIRMSGNTLLNKNAADVRAGDSGIELKGEPPQFGLEAGRVNLRNISAQVQDLVIANVLTTPSFKAEMKLDDVNCPRPVG